MKADIFATCTEGKIIATINLIDYKIEPDDLITLLPGIIIQFHERTGKVRLCFAGFSSECIEQTSPIKSMVSSFSKTTECPIVELQEDIASYLKDYFSLLARVTCDKRFSLSFEMTEVSLKPAPTAVELIYQRYSRKDHNTNHKEETYCKLVRLAIEHYTEERHAWFHVDKLGISLQHFSTTVKRIAGHNVLDVTAYVIITDAKARLKSAHMTTWEIAYSLNFPSASFFGRYFRRYVGMSLPGFRNS